MTGAESAPAEIQIAAPPELPGATTPSALARLIPVVMSVAAAAVFVASGFSGSTRNPGAVAFPLLMLVSLATTVLTGRGRRRGAQIAADRADYLEYLGRTRCSVSAVEGAQRESLGQRHPDPAALWTLVGGPRMWERRPADPDFCVVRIGVGDRPLAVRLVAPPGVSEARSDPVTVSALRRFLSVRSTIGDVPVVVALPAGATVTVDGDPVLARGLLAAMICQLAVLHAPDRVLIGGVIAERNLPYWEWLKWLPHNQHPGQRDEAGSARMVYPTMAAARVALASVAGRVLVLVDVDGRPTVAAAGMTVLEVGGGSAGAPVVIGRLAEEQTLGCPDNLSPVAALVCARRLAAHTFDVRPANNAASGWPGLAGIADLAEFDPEPSWRSQTRRETLRVPIGTTAEAAPVLLDIKEPAEHGVGPHGLCVGATGSGKSEVLRTIALGMMARNSPEVLNLLLVDFKGGATFLDLASAPHVAAVITNLADDAPLVGRMREALAGEVHRRQRLLRAAGNVVSAAAYQEQRRGGARLSALPSLFIVVDEFSELLSQHPDFADVFVMIGRLGRSLGIHLLLASQRLDEGRLRGLEAHLSYRICLKTLSASESRAVLGTADAYLLPNTPGAGILRCGSGEPTRFQTAFVSGPYRPARSGRAVDSDDASASSFTARPVGRIVDADDERPAAAGHTVLRAVLDRLAGRGPAAHRVWLPPLAASPTLGAVLRDAGPTPGALMAPIGLVDRPFEQCRTPLLVDVSGAAGNIAVVGAPRSGKSATLRTVLTALAATHEPMRVQFYCLDFGGGGLASLAALPHVGAVAGRSEPSLVVRMVAELESMVRSREVTRADARPDVFLVVDGWAGLRHEFASLEDSITALAAQGLSFGVHVVLSASRWAEIRPALRDQLGTRIELRLGDPADSELDRRQAQQVPLDRPGRGLSREGLHMLIAEPRLDGVEIRRGDSSAPPIPLLPSRVDQDALLRRAGDQCGERIVLGIDERRLQPVTLDFDVDPHLLILGDHECGKTAALRTLCREIVRTTTAARARVWIVDFRRDLLGVVESDHLGGYVMSPAALAAALPDVLEHLRRRMPPPHATRAQLRARSWWSGPDIYLVVDDYDLVGTAVGSPLSALLEFLPYARDLGLHLIIARRTGGLAGALFEPVLAGLRDLGCAGLMMSARGDEPTVFGVVRPTPLPPGRGVLVTRGGGERLVQVGWGAEPP